MRTLLFKKWLATRTRKVAAVLSVMVVFAGAAALAQLLWTESTSAPKAKVGGGSGTLTFSAVASVTGPGCLPGGTCDLQVNVSNTSSAPITLLSYYPDTLNSWNSNTCPAGGVNSVYSGPAETATSAAPQVLSPTITVAANASNQAVTLPAAIHMISPLPGVCAPVAGDAITSSGGAKIVFNVSAG